VHATVCVALLVETAGLDFVARLARDLRPANVTCDSMSTDPKPGKPQSGRIVICPCMAPNTHPPRTDPTK
jgi:hypothetical protein